MGESEWPGGETGCRLSKMSLPKWPAAEVTTLFEQSKFESAYSTVLRDERLVDRPPGCLRLIFFRRVFEKNSMNFYELVSYGGHHHGLVYEE